MILKLESAISCLFTRTLMTKMIFIIYDNLTLNNSNEEELLAVIADRKLTFHQRIKKTVLQSRSKIECLTETFSIH